MKKNLLLFGLLSLLIWSCGKDDGPTPPKNNVPVIANQVFSVLETIKDTDPIGAVIANDKDQDALEFTIKTNSSDLFEITKEGSLSLKAGKSLDFDAAPSHKITVEVTDGEANASAEITINVGNVNLAAPVIEPGQVFEAAENITPSETIGTVVATDADGDALQFSIATNDNELFIINNDGELSLAQGKELDFETSEKHNIVISVTDGFEETTAEVQISVKNIIEGPGEDPDSFVTTWDISSSNFELTIGKNLAYVYNFQIDWGDGTVEHITTDEPIQDIDHVYTSAGVYTVSIGGDFPAIVMLNSDEASRAALVSIDHWGINPWQSMVTAFASCFNFQYEADDKPNLAEVTSMEGMFAFSSFNGPIGDWEVGNVQNMRGMFGSAPFFNQNLGNWNISNVTNMEHMLDNSGMSTANYSNTLIGWADQDVVPSGITLGAEGLEYCGEQAAFAWAFLDEAKEWTINGDSQCP